MLPYEIHLHDLYRIIVGNVPWTFFIELLIRCVVCYTVLVVSIRMMGKRMAAQMSRNEMTSMVLMASAFGIPVTSPDRGIIPGIIIALIIVVGERWISGKISSNDKLESKVIGDIRVLVSDGVIIMNNLSSNRISRDRVFVELRGSSLKHLGQVKRFYFEADGAFTLIEEKEKKYGLCILPDFDKDIIKEQKQTNIEVCAICGKEKLNGKEPHPACDNCNNTYFVKAIEVLL